MVKTPPTDPAPWSDKCCADCAEWDYLSDHCSIDGPGESDCDGACPDFDDTRGKQDDH